MTIYDFKVMKNSWEEISLWDYKGKVLLIVNTASKCWLTPQYEYLEKLYKLYDKNDFEILWFPCNQFGNQEPWSNQEIQSFCKLNYWVTFQIFAKIDVNWETASPLYKFLKSEKWGFFWSFIKWNFTKFLIDQNGNVINRFSPVTNPLKIKSHIDKLLNNK